MKRFGEETETWKIFANEFVLHIKSNPKVATFVNKVYETKLELEQKMRRDLDAKILAMGVGHDAYLAIGDDLMKRLKSHAKFLRVYISRLEAQESRKTL